MTLSRAGGGGGGSDVASVAEVSALLLGDKLVGFNT